MTTQFAVKGRCHIGKVLTLRRFVDRDKAAEYALTINMDMWDDIWVEEVRPNSRHSIEPPSPPFVVMGDYVLDANKRKVASLLGSQEVKEAFASMLIGAFSHD